MSRLDLNYIGYAIAILFLVTWVTALAIGHFGHIEDKWSTDTSPS